jgi:hypothetical protein
MKKIYNITLFFFIFSFTFITACNKDNGTLSSETFARKSVDNSNSHSIMVTGFDITKPPKLLWTNKDIVFSKFSSPVIINNQIFAPSNDEGLVKLSLSDGQALASIPDLDIHLGQIAYDKGIVYFASDENLVAFDIKKDEVIWNIDFGHALVSLPLITDDLIIIGDDIEGVYGIYKSDGKVKWFYEVVNGIDYRGGIAGDASRLIFGGRDGNIYCLETTSGKEKWVYKTCNDISCNLVSCPTISNGIVYAGDYSGDIFAVDYSTGKEIWKKKYDSFIDWQNIAVNDKYIIITGASPSTVLNANFIVCLDKATGNEIWGFKKNAVSSHEYISDPLIINNDYVLLSTDDGTSLLDINSKKVIWTVDQKEGSVVNNNTGIYGFAVANGRLVYVRRGGSLVCYGLN